MHSLRFLLFANLVLALAYSKILLVLFSFRALHKLPPALVTTLSLGTPQIAHTRYKNKKEQQQ